MNMRMMHMWVIRMRRCSHPHHHRRHHHHHHRRHHRQRTQWTLKSCCSGKCGVRHSLIVCMWVCVCVCVCVCVLCWCLVMVYDVWCGVVDVCWQCCSSVRWFEEHHGVVQEWGGQERQSAAAQSTGHHDWAGRVLTHVHTSNDHTIYTANYQQQRQIQLPHPMYKSKTNVFSTTSTRIIERRRAATVMCHRVKHCDPLRTSASSTCCSVSRAGVRTRRCYRHGQK